MDQLETAPAESSPGVAAPAGKRGWSIVLVMFLTILLGGAGYMTQSLFFTPILKTFGWSRAKLSILPAMINLATAFGSLPVGWLLDWIAARSVIIVGILLIVLGFLLCGYAHSYAMLFSADLIMGLGIAASSIVPGAFLIATWFETNRALAVALIASGQSLGAMVSNLVVNVLITHFGWRAAFLILTFPLFFVMVPLVCLVVRVRVRVRVRPGGVASGLALPGYELREALGSRSFWLLVLAPPLYGFGAAGILLHFVPDLIALGYAPGRAALAIALLLGCAGVGKIVLGYVADRTGARLALVADLLVFAVGVGLLLFARHPAVVVLAVLVWGISAGAPNALLPVVVAESMGLRRYGTITGIANWAFFIGGVGGMIGGGWIYDSTGSYQVAFMLYMAFALISALGILAVRPYKAGTQVAAGTG